MRVSFSGNALAHNKNSNAEILLMCYKYLLVYLIFSLFTKEIIGFVAEIQCCMCYAGVPYSERKIVVKRNAVSIEKAIDINNNYL